MLTNGMSLGAFPLTDGRGAASAPAECFSMDQGSVRADRERRRVRRHIAGAERSARQRAVALDGVPAFNRALLLDELALYRRRGRFPINRGSRRAAVPAFVDALGTRCAVGHLMEVSGQGELVRFIARTRNHARVRELATMAEVRAWLAAAGLSVEEAARIQPTYCFLTEAEACFCQGEAAAAVAVGTTVATGSSFAYRIDRIEGRSPGLRVGDELPAIGRWDVGQQVLLRFDEEGLSSVGTDLTIVDGRVYCQVNPDTARRPVTIDTVFQAWRSEGAACIEVLASDDSLWNRSQCDGGSGEGEDADDAQGCGLAPALGFGAAELTSAAMFAALVARRRRRRRRR
jgi:hypothetical protein